MDKQIAKLYKAAAQIRRWLLKLCNTQAIHIGGDLSSTDFMTVLWQYQMNTIQKIRRMNCVTDLFFKWDMHLLLRVSIKRP